MDFKNKTAWVIGASSGIGRELCRQLAASGAQVILSSRKMEELQRIRQELPQPERHLCVRVDLGDPQDDKELACTLALGLTGRLDYVFLNGGISQRATVAETDLEVDRKIMEVNYFGNIALAKAVLPVFRRQNGGTYVVTSSIAGKFGFFLRSAYSASKHALHGFYESLMLEEEKYNVRVLMVVPGKINTPISKNALSADGTPHNEMDHNQATGMPVDECVRQIISALEKEKREVLIGNKEIKAVTLKRLLPSVFWKVIRKQSAT